MSFGESLLLPFARVIGWMGSYYISIGGFSFTFLQLAIFQLVAMTLAGLINYFIFHY